MRDILARNNHAMLEQFAWSNVLLAFDYDGTLAPIVSDAHQAEMRGQTRALLASLSALYPCVVISGRSRADALRRVRGLGVDEVIGNHGAEMSKEPSACDSTVSEWHARLESLLRDLRGVWIEDKRSSLAVHYRASREKKKARAAILDAVSRLSGARLVGGKQVVNIVPEQAPHKGVALERAMERLGCDTAIYVGDDDTDEDVFMLDQPGRLLTIRVGSLRKSAASYFIRDQRRIDVLLKTLLGLGRRHRAQRRARA